MPDTILDKAKAALDYFIGKGWSREQAAGIVGNLQGESGLDTRAVGDAGKAFGLAQWHPDRQSTFERVFGKPISSSTFEDQLAFVDWELNNTEKRAGDALRGTSSISSATSTFMKLFERPSALAASNSIGTRTDAANAAAGVPSGFRGLEYSIMKMLGFTDEQAQWGTDPNASVSGGVSAFLTQGIAGRSAAVVIGIILIGLAIAAFVLTNGNPQQIIMKGLKNV